MIDKVKLSKLQDLLREEEKKSQETETESTSTNPSLDIDATQVFDDALRFFGVLPPHPDESNSNGNDLIWNRGVTSSMFSMPLSAPPVTTLVPKKSLPQSLQSASFLHVLSNERENDNKNENNGGTRSDTSEEDELVEVPIAALMPDAQTSSQSQSHLPSQRPLAGNLSSKLVEYTRGQVGKRQPFKPGGMEGDMNETSNINAMSSSDNEYPEYCSPQEIEDAFQVLKKGAIAAWRDGTLITAPPGASYKVGLDLKDVYGDVVAVGNDNDNDKEDKILSNVSTTDEMMIESEGVNEAESSGGAIVSKLWDKSYFDDDSLFGDDSSSSSDDSSSGDSDSDEDDDDDDDDASANSSDDGDDDENPSDKQDVDDAEMKDEDDVQDIDALLTELTLSATASKVEQTMRQNKKKSAALSIKGGSNIHNPLQIADKRQQMASKERKNWAVTTSLNLQDFHSVVPNPAITYPFELDGFQKQAVARLERGECIFVAAHTSAGKTVCAEYAIALARKHCTRAIYTSPIKALSNQKYRDFQDKFGDDVGLITGDMQINADSSCLIMTTEILRSMLYRGADLIRDIEWVIFDEVHYINDSERGVVWEEVIIMLPDYVNMIFLSATTPNTNEFSDWIGRTKKKPVHVIRTDYRPVPLSHHLFAGRKLHKIKEGKSGFLDKGYKEASLSMLPASERIKKEQGKSKGGTSKQSQKKVIPTRNVSGSSHSAWQQSGSRQDWTALVKFLDRESLMPTVIFSFSKKKCEEIANMLRSLDLNTSSEHSAAHAFAIQTMKRLSPKDAQLPQVITTCEMVKRGIGVHHGKWKLVLNEAYLFGGLLTLFL